MIYNTPKITIFSTVGRKSLHRLDGQLEIFPSLVHSSKILTTSPGSMLHTSAMESIDMPLLPRGEKHMMHPLVGHCWGCLPFLLRWYDSYDFQTKAYLKSWTEMMSWSIWDCLGFCISRSLAVHVPIYFFYCRAVHPDSIFTIFTVSEDLWTSENSSGFHQLCLLLDFGKPSLPHAWYLLNYEDSTTQMDQFIGELPDSSLLVRLW